MKKNNYYIIILFLALFIYSCIESKKIAEVSKEDYLQNKYAEILQVNNSAIQNMKLYAFVDEWYGVNYKYGGLSKKGVDCSGFCSILYDSIYGIQIERTTQALVNKINEVEKDSLQEGHLVFFNIANKKNSHVGIYLTNQRFIHSSTSKGVIISSLENPYYKQNYSKGGSLQ
ncbi:MAG: C40 family peptidase [Vicingus serpentipes]|nr:C40 family peptidase [Vicingus serpentipes]